MLTITLLCSVAAASVLYLCICSVSTRRRHAAAAKQLGCRPAPTEYNPDRLGLVTLIKLLRANSKNQVLEYIRGVFDDVSLRMNKTVYSYDTHILGDRVFFTCDPRNIQAILATQFIDFELGKIRIAAFAPLLGHGIFSADGKQWEHSRALLRPQFSRDQVKDLDLEEKHVQNLLRALPVEADGWTSTTDIQPLISRFTMDSSSEFLFGESTNIQLSALSEEAAAKNAEDRAFVESFEACQDRMAKALLLNEFYSLMMTKKHRDDCRLCHQYIDRFVHTALGRDRKQDPVPVESSKKEKYVFLESLVNETRDPIEIRNQLLSILLAGRDTTASLLSFLFLMLVQHPRVFSKLRSIIIEDFGTFKSPQSLTFANLKACSYLQWCLSETLRLYPSVPLNGRRCTRDTSLPFGGGEDGLSPVFLPAGTEIAYLVYVMQRQPDFWGPDADLFRPERWQNHKYGFEYLPFNGGPRICLGQQFALTKAAYVTVRLLQRFDKLDGSSVPPGPIKWAVTLTGKPKDGVKLRLHAAP
ncbi:hypothetical protein LTR99_007794 [Exophiala xenobiotica]|uniref:Cytochrome P450 n=1 Tax=Vermiconidia calcicola TaxID=1690605 RepID=A0AAV9Q3U6_9PEZI|nr:hypothetical protein LTR92_001325 [Exophiala xenobiotica]KAK5535236.1 hypothetical protein LTR25_006244 [Vermiconidia calcicola]KAK5546737.1 hypothetical protein LTR23_003108 [Chaetothyriales sp. CCFEE 6169]KAK5223771.1 hypothetical protein LTR72_005157 [Exophiala xenobiotica]KAK5289172.1 hypothetical protein LTR14_007423 [Exophiala xenobiotica]